MTTERDRQAAFSPSYNWLVVSHPRGTRVACQAATADGAYRVAEAEHPGVQWAFATRLECHCHNLLSCQYAYGVCDVCGNSQQKIDMGTLPGPGGTASKRVCGFCLRMGRNA